ncbi:hypothetical protein [Actinomyces gerencseriae]|uniref:hypothetical protein n=1 Tax=Actinomyces gerencseriae TaxID=52769 RepID=UPI0023EFC9EB|nr:hypothetical protein [Actinomyces gerencseriae]
MTCSNAVEQQARPTMMPRPGPFDNVVEQRPHPPAVRSDRVGARGRRHPHPAGDDAHTTTKE